MKVGDIVKIAEYHWSDPGKVGVLLEDLFPSENNGGKAFKVLLDGAIKTKLAKHLEVISESG